MLVPESEKAEYEAALGVDCLTVPDEVRGLGPLRNWILANFTEEIVVMLDDDLVRVACVTRESPYSIVDPDMVQQIVYGAAICAKDAGAACFGFNQSWDVRKYRPDQPFTLSGWFGGVFGVVGRKRQFLRHHLFKVDVDYCLEGLRHERFVWKDERFGFIQARDRNKGGNAKFRTAKKVADEIAFLKAKWGKHIKFKDTTAGTTVSIDVPRRDRFARVSGVSSTAVRRSQNNT